MGKVRCITCDDYDEEDGVCMSEGRELFDKPDDVESMMEYCPVWCPLLEGGGGVEDVVELGVGGELTKDKVREISGYIQEDFLTRDQASLIAGVRPDSLMEKVREDADLDLALATAEARAVKKLTGKLNGSDLSSAEVRALERLIAAIDPGRFSTRNVDTDKDIVVDFGDIPAPPERLAEEIAAAEAEEE